MVALCPATAHAYGLTNVVAEPASTQAGAHSAFHLHLEVTDAADDLKRLQVSLPPGLVGNPRAQPVCATADFLNDACADASRVGDTTVSVIALGMIPMDVTGSIYSITPVGAEPARLGVVLRPPLLPKVFNQASVALRDDGGLDTTLDDLPTESGGLPIDITKVDMTLRASFMTNPTACVLATTHLAATSYAGTSAQGSASFTPTGCDSVPFDPSIAIAPATQTADKPGEIAVTIAVPPDSARVRDATVTLPVGTALSAGVAHGLEACPAVDQECPAASKIGTLTFDTPLLGALPGDVYLGAPTPDDPLRLFLRVDPAGLDVRIAGSTHADPQTGQVTTTFKNLPPVPFSAFTLRFRGGDTAVLTAPPGCGEHTVTSSLVPDSDPGHPRTPTTTFTTVDCPAPAFTPTLQAGLTDATAGAFTASTMTVTRPDGQPRIASMRFSLPPGLAGSLKGLAPGTRLGGATVTSGTGNAPLTLGGDVYLTPPPVPGALAGLAIVVPAKAGPLDLGTVVTQAALTVRPDAGIDVTAASLPQIVGGIPLALRALTLTLDRPGFLRNATSCAPAAIAASFTATTGETASASAPYQPTGCDRIAYAPKLAVELSGQTGKSGRPRIATVITQGEGEAATRHVEVTLPPGLGADLGVVARACPVAALAANSCAPSSIVGKATAVTPLLDAPLTGVVRVVQQQGSPLPALAVELKGALALTLKAGVAFTAGGRIKTVFDGIPDVPLSRFELAFEGGSTGILIAGEDLCAKARKADAAFTSHAGKSYAAQVPAKVAGCRAATPRVIATLTRAKTRRPRLTVSVTGVKVTRVRVTLPRALRTARGGRVLTLRKAKATVTLRRRGRLGTRPTIKVSVRRADGRTSTLTVRLRRR